MSKLLHGLVAAGVLTAGMTAAAAPAAAHDGGLAVASGLLGLGVGAAIASDHRDYYAPPPPPPAPVGYYYDAPPPPPPPPGYYGYAPRCRIGWHWSGYWHQYVQDRRCW